MSQVSPEIKALVDKGLTCWNSGEIDLMADDYADDAEVDTTAAFPDGRRYRGREEFVGYFHDLWDAWDRLRMEPLDFAEVGGGRIVVEVRLTGTGRSSGIEIDQRAGFLYSFREPDRKVARVQLFPSKDAALEAAGPSEGNIEVVRKVYERINADRQGPIPPSLFHTDYEHDARDVGPGIGIVRGREAADKALREYFAMFEDFHIELLEVLHADEVRVITAVQDGGRMKGTDAAVSNRLFHVFIFREGKVARVSSHTDRNRALEAAGLPN